MKTINQLLEQISDVPLDLFTEELGKTRQKLIDLKRSHPKGGLIMVENTEKIEEQIKQILS